MFDEELYLMKMKRNLVLALVVGVLNYNIAFASVENPFGDVDTSSWTYGSMEVLAQNGIIDGASFVNGKTLTRYEMSALVAKAMWKFDKSNVTVKAATQSNLEKLEKEFSPELKNMGVPISSNIQAQLQATIKTETAGISFSGGSRMRYQINPNLAGTNKTSSDPSRFQERFSLNISAPVANKLTFNAQLWTENSIAKRNVDTNVKTSTNVAPIFDKGEFVWKNASTILTIGRFQPILGQGIIYAGGEGNAMDGIYGTYKIGSKFAMSVGYADLNAGFNTGVTVNAAMQNVEYKITDKATLTVAHMKILNNPKLVGYLQKNGSSYKFDQYSLGGKVKTGVTTIILEGVKNNASGLPAGAQRNGVWGRVQWKASDYQNPGTWQTSIDYLKMGNWSIDSDFWKIVLPVPGGNGINGDGAQGFGFDFDYVVAKNLDVDFKYYALKPYDSNKSSFSSYSPYLGFITNWRF